jgi:hypothetical protein
MSSMQGQASRQHEGGEIVNWTRTEAIKIRRLWESGLVWRFGGWRHIASVRFDCVEMAGPFDEPS